MDLPSCLSSIPSANTKRLAVYISKPAQRLIRSGHPWLFENSITQSDEGTCGDLAVVFDQNHKFLAIGLYDPESTIRVRILHYGKPMTINDQWFEQKIHATYQKRAFLQNQQTNGFRIIHGENDGFPGLVVDKYDQTWVIKIYTPAWIPHLKTFIQILNRMFSSSRLILRMNRLTKMQTDKLYNLFDGEILIGEKIEAPIIFQENGIYFEADPLHGQKTGFFLDQRENRARVEQLSAHRHVLNVFSYNGGFSLYAARGGARSVTSLDLSKPAMESALRNFQLNHADSAIQKCPHHVIIDDAFKAMQELSERQQKYGMVIIDPPSFAKKQEEYEGAMKAYSKLVRLGVHLLQAGGVLVMASCSSRVGVDDFFRMVETTLEKEKRQYSEIMRTRHAVDHPIGYAEGSYLKCLFLKIEN